MGHGGAERLEGQRGRLARARVVLVREDEPRCLMCALPVLCMP